jgi:multidrug resistance efflux pump
MRTTFASDAPGARRWLVGLAAAAAVAVWASGLGFHASNSEPHPQPSSAATAAEGNAQPAVVSLGTADVEGGLLSLSPSVPGRVVEVLVRENESVKAGVPLLRMDDELAQLQVHEAEAALRAAEAQAAEAANAPRQHGLLVTQQEAAVTAAGHDLAAARLVAERKRALARARTVNQEEADAGAEVARKLEAAEQAERAKLESIRLRDPAREVARAEADVAVRRAQLDKARRILRDCELRAPVTGTAIRVFAHVGELVSPQSKFPSLLFRPTGPDIVRAEVGQEFAAGVRVGQRVHVRDEAQNDSPSWYGQVSRIAAWYGPRRTILPETLPLQEARTLECIIALDAGQVPLRVGQRMRVEFLSKP